MKTKLLNLEESLQMYELIRKFEGTDIAKLPIVIGAQNYIKCLKLLTGETKETIQQAKQEERLVVLLEGFKDNRLLDLPRLKVDGLYG
jgi:hypothetical protein